jgi:hypothetical protein
VYVFFYKRKKFTRKPLSDQYSNDVTDNSITPDGSMVLRPWMATSLIKIMPLARCRRVQHEGNRKNTRPKDDNFPVG